MPKITQHTPGMFSWADLATAEPAAAKEFYTSLFGWSYDDQPAGPNMVYSMASIHDGTVAALFQQREDERQNGIPSHWTCYFTVSDLEATAAQVPQLGGKLVAAPFDVWEAGRMCVLADPGSAICALWHPKQRIGATVIGQHGALTWAELLTRNVDAAGGFYAKLHGYAVDAMPMPNGTTYTVFKVGDKPACGLMVMPPEVPSETPPHWTPYFNVDDCDVAIEKALAGGGRQLSPVIDVTEVGRFATLADPQGATFAVLQSAGG